MDPNISGLNRSFMFGFVSNCDRYITCERLKQKRRKNTSVQEKRYIMTKFLVFVGLALALTVTGCSPEVGSEKWCKNMKDTPKDEWSTKDVTDYAQHCVFK